MICIARGDNVTMRVVKQKLAQALSCRQKRNIFDKSRVRAAVLVPVYSKHGQHYILFTKRTEKVKEHKGQISFPGGAYQKGDRALVATALRECTEEIGLMPDEVEVLGELDDTVSRTSNYIISPFVAVISWPHQLKVDREEVEEIIEVPIQALLDEARLHQETEIVNGEEVTSYFYHYEGRIIWGATARILNQFLNIFVRII